MATITPKTTTQIQIGPCTLIYTAVSAQLLNSNGVQVWAIAASMFAPAQAGTPPVVSVTVVTTSRTIHPPPPPPCGTGNANEEGSDSVCQVEVEVVPLSAPIEPATTVTTTTITITLTGARFAGTNIPADCSMVIKQISNSDDPGSSFPSVTYSQSFGGLSFSGEDDDFLGFVTVTAALPAASLSLPQGSTAMLDVGLMASIDMAPGLLRFYTAAGNETVVQGSSPSLGSFAATTLTLAATQGTIVLSFPAPAPPFQTAFTIEQTGGWIVPPPGTATDIGTLSAAAGNGAAAGNNFDTALILAGEDASANLTFVAILELTLATSAAQYTLALAGGLALAGDTTAAPVQISLTGCQLNLNFQAATPVALLSSSFALLNPAPLTTGSIALWPVTGGIAGGAAFDFSVTPAAVSSAFLNITQALCSLPDAVTRPLPWTGNTGLALVTAPPPVAPAYASYLILGPAGAASGATRIFVSGISLEVTRTADMMVASFAFSGCGVAQLADGSLQFAELVQNPGEASGTMIVTLPPQHISECAYPLADDNTPQGALGPPPVPTRMAAATSLALVLPAQASSPLSAAVLLDWTQFLLSTPPPGATAQPDPTTVTSLELPYRLLLALDQRAGWVQPLPPDPSAAASPLWHARLGLQQARADGTGAFINERSSIVKTACATWTYDTPTAPGSAFADEALTAQNREDIVYETEQTSVAGTGIAVDHLILSPLGAWADLRSIWPGGTPPAGHSLSAWTQIISQGRDQYVRAVTVGYLLPWGHVASVVEVAERRFSNDANNTAYLSTKKYIVVGQVTRTYTQQPSGAPMLRDAVLTRVDLLTQITPSLDQTSGAITVPGDTSGPAFWPYVAGQPFLFQARVYDNDLLAQPPYKSAETTLAAVFVDATSSDALITAALNAFNAGTTTPAAAQVTPHTDPLPTGSLIPGQLNTLNTAVLNGQKLALATSNTLGDTTHAITNLTMQASSLVPAGTPWNLASPIANFYPSLNQATVSLPAVGLLTSAAATNVAVSYLPQYLDPATDGSNPVDAYMGLATPVLAALSGAKANGLVAPSLAIAGLSRTFGALTGDVANPTAPLANLLAGTLNPSQFFPSDAKLLNLIPFSDLVGTVEGLTSFDTTHIPQVKVDTSVPTKLVATMNWVPTLSWPPPASTDGTPAPTQQNTWNAPGGFVSLTLNGDLAGSITLNSTITTPVAPGPLPGPIPAPIPAGAPVSTMVATVNNFTLNILGLVQINFASLTFTSTTGKKPSVQVSLAPTNPFVLTGDIDFLQVLFEAIEDLFSSGPSIGVDDDAIKLSFEFAIPDLGMGVFDLSGIAIGIDVILSLSAAPVEFHFHYAEPNNPFNLAVDLLGGGGYFTVDASDLASTSISLAAQAGASVSLDLGVASGSISIMLGAFFNSSSANAIAGGSGPSLGGYVRADGQLSVLDLISLHVSFYLGIAYDPGPGIIWGEASVKVEVSVLFFHTSVTLTLRKQFNVKNLLSNAVALDTHDHAALPRDAGPVWPIPRDQIMDADDWTTYTQAFA